MSSQQTAACRLGWRGLMVPCCSMAWGGERGVVVVDMSRRALVCCHAPAALYLAPAPAPRQPERQRSPSLDQVTAARPLLRNTHY